MGRIASHVSVISHVVCSPSVLLSSCAWTAVENTSQLVAEDFHIFPQRHDRAVCMGETPLHPCFPLLFHKLCSDVIVMVRFVKNLD